MLDRAIVPDFVIPERFQFQQVKSVTFTNDITCHHLSSGDQPLVKLELYFKGGKALDNASYVSLLTAKMLVEGTTTRSAEDIAELIAYYGAHIEVNAGNENLTVVIYALNKHLKPIFNLLTDLLENASFREEDLERVRQIQLQNLKVNEAKSSYLASRKFKELIFPSHYYGSIFNERKLSAITTDQLKEYYQKYVKNKTYEIFLTGKIDQDILLLVEDYFGSKKVDSFDFKIEEPEQGHISGRNKIEIEGAVQSSIRYGFRTISKDHKDFYEWSVTNEILGGYFGSRLMSNIREDKGYTYGIGSYLTNFAYGSYFQIVTDVKGANAEDTIKEIEKELNRLKTELVPVEELDRLRNYLFGSFASSLNTSFDLMDKFKSVYLFGMDYSFYETYFNLLKEIDSNRILDISNQYLSKDPVIVICGA